MKVSALIVAGGEGRRMGQPKQFIEIDKVPMVIRSCMAFEDSSHIDEVVLVVSKEDIEKTGSLVKQFGLKKISSVVAGGERRQDSVLSGLAALSKDSDFVLIHDGARPLITREIISRVVTELNGGEPVVIGVPIVDTVKVVSDKKTISETLDRDALWAAQTPQAFPTKLIKEVHERAKKNEYSATDDSKLVERLGHKVRIIMGSYENIKITTPSDLVIAEAIIKGRAK